MSQNAVECRKLRKFSIFEIQKYSSLGEKLVNSNVIKNQVLSKFSKNLNIFILKPMQIRIDSEMTK